MQCGRWIAQHRDRMMRASHADAQFHSPCPHLVGLDPAVHVSSRHGTDRGRCRKSKGENQMIGLKKTVSFFAGFLLLAGYAAAASAAESSTAAAIHAITQAWVKAYNAGDAKAVAGLYAEQAVLLPPGAPAAKGKAAIQAYIAKDAAESAKAGVT